MPFDPGRAINAVHRAFGVPVQVLDGAPRTIRAVRRIMDDIDRLGSREVLSTSVLLEVRSVDMSGICAGVRLLVDGEMRVVRGVPEYRDADRLVAVVNTAPDGA